MMIEAINCFVGMEIGEKSSPQKNRLFGKKLFLLAHLQAIAEKPQSKKEHQKRFVKKD
jgi:hypothetical protein